jgi:hypothetical protein
MADVKVIMLEAVKKDIFEEFLMEEQGKQDAEADDLCDEIFSFIFEMKSTMAILDYKKHVQSI